MADFYDRLDGTRRSVAAAEQEITDNQRAVRAVEEQGNFTQDLYRRQRRLFDTVSGCWQGSSAVKALQGYSDQAERSHRQATEAVQREHERLRRRQRELDDRYDQALRQYNTVKAER